MKKSVFSVLIPTFTLTLLLVGCSSPDPTPTPTATATPSPTPTVVAEPTPTATIEGALPEVLFLEITEPEDESVVTEEILVVRGSTTPDAVVSIGEVTVDVDAQGQFAATITLELGPNILEIVASNLTGDQKSVLRSVVYLP